jgi:hypothetical protein
VATRAGKRATRKWPSRAGGNRRAGDPKELETPLATGLIAVRACALALAVMLGGCSASEIVQNLPSSSSLSDLAEPDYRRIVADNIKVIFPGQAATGDLEISGVRLVDHLKGPAWLTCLKLDAHGKPQQYAIFIQDNKIIDSREGIVIDQCYKQTYTPLDIAAITAAKKPAR